MKGIVNAAWVFVHAFQVPVLIVDLFGDVQAFTVTNFKPKSRDFFENVVTGARDITPIIENLEVSVAKVIQDKASFEAKWNNIPKKEFSFSHDNYVILKNIQENEY